MSIFSWFAGLFGAKKRDPGPKAPSTAHLGARMTALDQEQAGLMRDLNRAKQDKEQLYVRGLKTFDEQEKKEIARRIARLNADIQNLESLVASLDRQKANVDAEIRAIRGVAATQDTRESTNQAQTVERMSEEYQVRDKALTDATEAINVAERGRFESAPEESEEVQSIFDTLKAAPAPEQPKAKEKE